MGVLNISGLAKIVGMNVHTIRAWERRYGALEPERTPSGQRTYSLEDVEKLRKLKNLNDMGMPISQIAAMDIRELTMLEQNDSIVSTAIEKKEKISDFQAKPEEIEKLTNKIIDSLNRYDVESINHELNRYRTNMSSKDFVLKVISPLFQQVGRMVLELKLDIAQEHILSAIIRNQISFLITPTGQQNSPSIALTTPEGDLHEFGIIMSQVLCICNDIKPYYLGPNLPVSSLIAVTKHLQLDHLILGCTAQNLGYERHSFAEYIREYLDRAEVVPDIWVGGKAAALLDLEAFGGKVKYVPNLHVLDEYLKALNDKKTQS